MNKCEILNIAVGPDGVLLLEQNDSLNLSRIVNNKSENGGNSKRFVTQFEFLI